MRYRRSSLHSLLCIIYHLPYVLKKWKEGRKEGRKEEWKEGEKEGRKEGRKEGSAI